MPPAVIEERTTAIAIRYPQCGGGEETDVSSQKKSREVIENSRYECRIDIVRPIALLLEN